MFLGPSWASMRALPIQRRWGTGRLATVEVWLPAGSSVMALTTANSSMERCSRASEKLEPSLRTGPLRVKP